MNKDLVPIQIHWSIQESYTTKVNTDSTCLARIAEIGCSPKCPTNKIITHFENHTSLNSTQGRITFEKKKFLCHDKPPSKLGHIIKELE